MDFKTKHLFRSLLSGLNNTFISANQRIAEVLPMLGDSLHIDQGVMVDMGDIDNFDMLKLVEHGGDKELYNLITTVVNKPYTGVQERRWSVCF